MPKPMYHFFNIIEDIRTEEAIVIDRTLNKSRDRLREFLRNTEYMYYTTFEYHMSMEKGKDGWYSITM